ncbi:MAG: hypothetical protein PHN56_06765 [Candidatus Nanoarchaeia archaeon]|nr:hypothetical protein [Candidatus Nanoarchaeia archaeon]
MAADVFAFYTTVSMGLFTVLSIIVGYLLLNNAIISTSRGSAYYVYTRISDSISNAMYSGVSSMTNINLYKKYIIFSAYFESKETLYYKEMEGLKLFSYGINQDDANSQILKDINKSVTGDSYSNENKILRKELEKCIGDVCLCFGEVEVPLKLEFDYFTPLACVDVCWGEYPNEYPLYVTNELQRVTLKNANEKISTDYPESSCNTCVTYMNSANDYSLLQNQGFNAIVTKYQTSQFNSVNYLYLKEFSEATKFSFIPNIIECRTMSELSAKSGKTFLDSKIPHLFVFEVNSEQKGLFTILTPKSENLLFKILSLEYNSEYEFNDRENLTISVVKTSFIKSEPLKDDSIFGGN